MNEINDNKKAMSEDVKQALIRFNKDNIYVQNLKIELADMSLGYVKGKMMVTEDVLNPYGSVHGGCLYSLADIVSGIAACTYGKFSSTIDDIYSSGYEHGVSHMRGNGDPPGQEGVTVRGKYLR